MARSTGILALALLNTLSRAAPMPTDQTVLLANPIDVLDSEEHFLRVNTTFDAVELGEDKPMEKLEGYGYLEFINYKIFDPEAAAAKDLLNKSDINCAASSPNALLILPQDNGGAAIFRSNASALRAANLPEFFDFVSFEIKPLTMNATSEGAFVFGQLNAWTIEDGNAKDVQTLGAGFGSIDGTFEPWVLEPRSYFPGWGQKVNFIEFTGTDQEGKAVPFCLDNIVLEFSTDDQ